MSSKNGVTSLSKACGSFVKPRLPAATGSILDVRDWDLSVLYPERGPWVRNHDVRPGDFFLIAYTPTPQQPARRERLLIQATDVRSLAPSIRARALTLDRNGKTESFEVPVSGLIVETGQRPAYAGYSLRPRPAGACLLPESYWNN